LKTNRAKNIKIQEQNSEGKEISKKDILVDVQWVDDKKDAHYVINPTKVGDTRDGRAGIAGKILRHIEPTLSRLTKQYEKQPRSPGYLRDPLAPKDYDVADYIKELSDDKVSIFTGFQGLYQVIFDKAAEDLGAAKGDKYFKLAKSKMDALSQISLPLASHLEVTKNTTGFI